MLLVVLTLLALWFGLDTAKDPRRFISVAGMLVYVGISWVCSKHRRKVSYVVFIQTTFVEKKNKLVLRVLSLMLSNTTGALMVKEFKKNQEHRLSESDYRVNDVLSGGHNLQLKTGNK